MTRDGYWSGGAPQAGYQQAGYQHPHAGTHADPHAGISAGSAPEASRIEALLHSVIDRLEENETRYNTALNALETRLGELSARAAGNAAAPGYPDDAYTRLGNQAAELAQQVRSASQTQRPRQSDDRFRAVEDRISEFAAQMQQRAATPPPDNHHYSQAAPAQTQSAPQGFGQQFTNAAAGFEQSLAAGHATAELESINARIDDLVERFDAMTSGRSADRSMLDTVEIQLNNLAAQFDQAREHYARVDAIESNLVHLMDMTRESESRIEAVAMRAASEAARNAGNASHDVSDRLDAVQRELQALASMTGSAGNAAPVHPAPSAHPEYDAQPAPAHSPAELREAFANRPAPAANSLRDELERSRVGASIPDYQAAPAVSQPHKNFDDDADFLASARRAAAAAAASTPPAPRKKSLFSGLRRAGQSPARGGGETAKPRSLFVAATVFLMIASAALIYGRMNEQGAGSVVDAPGQSRPANDNPAPKPNSSSMLSATPHIAERKDESKLPSGPAPAERTEQPRAPLATDPAPVTLPGQLASSRGTANYDPTSLPPEVHLDPGIPGIAVRIIERDEKPVPAAVTPDTPRAALPARPAPPAAPASSTPSSPMPPAAIGPQSLRVAASRGDASAQYEIASRYAKGSGVKQDYKQAAQWFARAAAQSLAPAQYRLAAFYERGRGVEKDQAMARLWYERAAKAGNVRAMHNLGVIHSGSGEHRPNHSEAAKWFSEAARYGLADSQFNLGILHEAGLGVKQDLIDAYRWFSLAAMRGDGEAEKRKQAVAGKLRADQIRIADQAVRQWRAKEPSKNANEVRPPEGGWRAASAGDSGAERGLVLKTQSLLNKLGYDAGVPDGLTGPQTISAIRRFQERNALSANGKVTPELVSRLEALTS